MVGKQLTLSSRQCLPVVARLAAFLAAACDSVLLVVPENEADTPQTDALLRLIPQQGARLAGCILVAEPSPSR